MADGDTRGARRLALQVKAGAPPRPWRGWKGKHRVGATKMMSERETWARSRIQLCHFTPHEGFVFFFSLEPHLRCFPLPSSSAPCSRCFPTACPVCGNSQQKRTHASDVEGEAVREGSRSPLATGTLVTLTSKARQGPQGPAGAAPASPPLS